MRRGVNTGIDLGVPALKSSAVGLSAASPHFLVPRSLAGFPLLSLTRIPTSSLLLPLGQKSRLIEYNLVRASQPFNPRAQEATLQLNSAHISLPLDQTLVTAFRITSVSFFSKRVVFRSASLGGLAPLLRKGVRSYDVLVSSRAVVQLNPLRGSVGLLRARRPRHHTIVPLYVVKGLGPQERRIGRQRVLKRKRLK